MEKEISQIKTLKTSIYLDPKDQDKINQFICLYIQKNKTKKKKKKKNKIGTLKNIRQRNE